MSLLRLDEVACIRGGRLLFEGLSLALEPGGAAIVTGANGAGKSSLIRIAAGLLRASGGNVTHEPAALVDDALALDERLPLAKALGFWAKLDGTQTALQPMGLEHLAEVPVRMLSTGQRKRAALARVAASGARLWLLDEPLNGLDADGQERLSALMAEHRRAGGAILAASHQPLRLAGAQTVTLG